MIDERAGRRDGAGNLPRYARRGTVGIISSWSLPGAGAPLVARRGATAVAAEGTESAAIHGIPSTMAPVPRCRRWLDIPGRLLLLTAAGAAAAFMLPVRVAAAGRRRVHWVSSSTKRWS